MSLPSQTETHDSSGPSNRTSMNGVLQDISSRESIQSHEGSISNFSVHSTTDAIHKDLFDLSGQGGTFLPHYFSDSSSGQDPSISDYKSLHSFEKPTFGFRNQSLSTISTIREPESNRSSTATSTPSLLSLEDEAESTEISVPSAPQSSRAIAGLIAAMEISTNNTPPVTPIGTTSRSSQGMVTLEPTPSAAEVHTATRVRALRSFGPAKVNELAFEKGDIIKVVNRGYKDWWGQLGGRTGIFQVNYVVRLRTNLYLWLCQCLHSGGIQEPLPEPTHAELAAEALQEAAVFSQTAHVDRLFTMLSTLDPARDNLVDNEEIQELHRSYMFFRPKIVKLIDEYSQKLGMLSCPYVNMRFLRN